MCVYKPFYLNALGVIYPIFRAFLDDFMKPKYSLDKKRGQLDISYPLGTGLVQFMEERKFLTTDFLGTVRVFQKSGSYYLKKSLFAVCNFDISLLPFNLPMICKPMDWRSACPPGQTPKSLSDLTGGYLSGLTGELYDR